MSSAYVVGQVTVHDPERWMEYVERVPETLAPWGGEVIMRGQRTAMLAGEPGHPNIVMLRFPDRLAVEQWYASPEYQALVPLRDSAAQVELAAYEG
ncbi:MAG: DUF1330 domain-containing protein [Halomonadaceae bacterium]|jgi:uncharacterized protein (DUF1330 family)|uniref:DUF1330 domain-containing protein n=1 Tax=Halomonas sp. MCCC 1A11062 TaxID=2733485 RepID=UPI001F39C4BC|nr:DUF1330 domain-containing protein [Halomonas sp. MCCC 1A11062]MCE8038594.1 DUF1330 domain-containing protein [Halomonas sp. MCCC 1A11062]